MIDNLPVICKKEQKDSNYSVFFDILNDFYSAFFHFISIFLAQFFKYQNSVLKSILKNGVSKTKTNFLKEMLSSRYGFRYQFFFFVFLSSSVSLITIILFFWRLFAYFLNRFYTKKKKVDYLSEQKKESQFYIDLSLGSLNLLLIMVFHLGGFLLSIPEEKYRWEKIYFPLGEYFLPNKGKITVIFFYFFYQEMWHLVAPLFFIRNLFKKYSKKFQELFLIYKRKVLDFLCKTSVVYHFLFIFRPIFFNYKLKNCLVNSKTFIYPYFYWAIGFNIKDCINFEKIASKGVNILNKISEIGFFWFSLRNLLILPFYLLLFKVVLKILLWLNLNYYSRTTFDGNLFYYDDKQKINKL